MSERRWSEWFDVAAKFSNIGAFMLAAWVYYISLPPTPPPAIGQSQPILTSFLRRLIPVTPLPWLAIGLTLGGTLNVLAFVLKRREKAIQQAVVFVHQRAGDNEQVAKNIADVFYRIGWTSEFARTDLPQHA